MFRDRFKKEQAPHATPFRSRCIERQWVMRTSNSVIRNALVLLCTLVILPFQLAQAQGVKPGANYEEKRRETNDIAVTIVTSGITCTCARFAEDIRNVVNDLRPNGLRV